MDEARTIPASVRPVWYAGSETVLGELWTMLHLPYTLMVLCFVVLGAVLSPSLSWTLLAVMLGLYFVGLGIGSHLLDQVTGMGSKYAHRWTDRSLWAGGLAAIGAATALGLWGSYYFLGPAVAALVAVQAFFAVAYPLAPVFRGWFHGDAVFAFSWATLPFLVSYVAQSGSLTWPAFLIAAGLGGVGFIEIRLSRRARAERKRTNLSSTDGLKVDENSAPKYLRTESQLKWLVGATYTATLIVLLIRIVGIGLGV